MLFFSSEKKTSVMAELFVQRWVNFKAFEQRAGSSALNYVQCNSHAER